MYAFLIAVTIILPGERNSFNIYSSDQFSHPICTKLANEVAERAVDYTKRRMPYAIVTTAASCSIRATRLI